MVGSLLYSLSYLAAGSGQADCGDGLTCSTHLPVVNAGTNELQAILQIVFGVMAAVAVLMIVIAGFRFISGAGNSQETAKARSTIIYAIAGLVVALIAEAIVTLVLDKLT